MKESNRQLIEMIRDNITHRKGEHHPGCSTKTIKGETNCDCYAIHSHLAHQALDELEKRLKKQGKPPLKRVKEAAKRLARKLEEDEHWDSIWPDDNGLDQERDYDEIVLDWLKRHKEWWNEQEKK